MKDESNPETVEETLEEVIRPTQAPLLGLPDGMDPAELDADKTISDRSADYGTTNSGNTLLSWTVHQLLSLKEFSCS